MYRLKLANKKTILSICLTFMIAFTFGYMIRFSPLTPKKAFANVYVLKETPKGHELTVHNTLTDLSEREVRNILGFNNVTTAQYKYITLGNSTVDQTKTILDTEAVDTGFIRAEGTVIAWLNGADYAFNVSKKFTATGNIEVNAVGLHNNATSLSDNTMLAIASLGGSQAFENNWNCTIIWVITANFN